MYRPSPPHFRHVPVPLLRGLLALGLMFMIPMLAPSNPALAQNAPPTAAVSAAKHSGNWENLSPVQQRILAPLEEDWSYLSNERRQKWIQVANLYPKMKTVDQERLQLRMNDWAKLSQKDRRIARDNYLSSLRFPAEEKTTAWQAYQQLSPEEKKKLAAKEDKKKKPTAANSPALQARPPATPSVTPAAAPKKDEGA
ncbi:MAG: DUF3106 domain-containing protein [Polynucleobacter sp.]|nr:DUF3106 domain-containing protein [Polynucleobacter sp.]